MKNETKQADTKGQSLVFLHEVLLFAGAAILLSVAYPRAQLMTVTPETVIKTPVEETPGETESIIESPIALENSVTIIVADHTAPGTNNLSQSPVTAVESTRLLDTEQLLANPEAVSPIQPDVIAEPAS